MSKNKHHTAANRNAIILSIIRDCNTVVLNAVLQWLFVIHFEPRYHDSMPLVFDDEVCYEKTPDYFDRPFVPERMSKLENAENVKFVHVVCDPVRRSFSHFNHMFTVQATGQGGVGEAQPGFEFLNGEFDLQVTWTV